MAQFSHEAIKSLITSQMKGLQLLEQYDADGELVYQRPPVPEKIVFLDLDTVVALHTDLQTQGTLRDEGLLESALARANQAAAYAMPTMQEMGLLIAEGIIRNYPFTDGNKRTAQLALCAFLTLNSVSCPEDSVKTAEMLLALTIRKISIEDASEFLRLCPQIQIWEKMQATTSTKVRHCPS